jgi:hypothetical protein
MKLFLDATCFPQDDSKDWVIVRTVEEAIKWVEANGFPDFVSFKNDLGKDQMEGNEFAIWLTEHDRDTGAMPDGFGYDIRGQSPAGDELIREWIDRHLAERAAYKAAGYRWPNDLPKNPWAMGVLATNPNAYQHLAATPTPGLITFYDCCRMILQQGPPDRARVFADQPNYRRDLFFLLNKEFGIEWNDSDPCEPSRSVRDADGRFWREGVPYIAGDLVRHYCQVTVPWSGYLEYTYVKGEMEVWKTEEGGIVYGVTALKECFVAFFHDLLLLRWPDAKYRTTSWEKLEALGLGERVDDPDNF